MHLYSYDRNYAPKPNSNNEQVAQVDLHKNVPSKFSYADNNKYRSNVGYKPPAPTVAAGPGLIGLVNLGNTCYLNSVLQMFSNIPEFKNYFLQRQYQYDLFTNVKRCQGELENNIINIDRIAAYCSEKISGQFEKLFRHMWAYYNDEQIIKPNSFKKALGKKNGDFNSHNQQDAHECIVVLLDIIEDELSKETTLEPLYQRDELKTIALFEMESDNINKLPDSDEKRYRSVVLRQLEDAAAGYMKRYKQLAYLKRKYAKKHSKIDDLFAVGQIDTLECTNCKYMSHTYCDSYCLMLEIPENKFTEQDIQDKIKEIHLPFLNNPDKTYNVPEHYINSFRRKKAIDALSQKDRGSKYTLDDCLKLTLNEELLDFERTCDFCKTNNKSLKRSSLFNIPKYLILSLKRFDHLTNTKKSHFIEFPEDLDIARYIDSELPSHLDTNTKYTLISVINHVGILGGGHYYCYSRNILDGQWYNYNDEQVSRIDNVVTESAYIMVYAREDLHDYPMKKNNNENIDCPKSDRQVSFMNGDLNLKDEIKPLACSYCAGKMDTKYCNICNGL
jgi:ubiquitin C-terminal hydrolase